MKKLKLFTILLLACAVNISTAQAGASGHAGHSGGGGGGANACFKPHISKYLPPNLATVAPGSEFSFVVANLSKPEQLQITVKGESVPFTYDDKEAFILVKGNLPAGLKNTVARVSIKVVSPMVRCDAEGGWLLKISE
ncbi:MAG: hypothetical protein ABL925_06115 [Methylococcales bacterium]